MNRVRRISYVRRPPLPTPSRRRGPAHDGAGVLLPRRDRHPLRVDRRGLGDVPKPDAFSSGCHPLLLRQLEPQADALPGVAIVLDTDIKFADDTVYRPDVAIYLPGRLPDDADYPDIPPDLIIEVISPSSEARDLLTNRTDYARFGVTEYWVVDPGAASVRCFRAARKSRKYARTIVTKTAIDSAAVPGIRIDLGLARRKLGRKRPPRR